MQKGVVMGRKLRVLPSVKRDRLTIDASKALASLHDKLGSWEALERKLGINRGLLNAVYHFRKRAPNRLLHALGLPMRTMPAPVCPIHGIPHITKRCPRTRPTFEQNCAARAVWLAANAGALAEIVEWAERKTR